MPISINAQAMPALNIVSTTPQPLNTTMVKNSAKNSDDNFIFSNFIPLLNFQVLYQVFTGEF